MGDLHATTALHLCVALLPLAAVPITARADTPVLPQGGTVVVGTASNGGLPGSLNVTTGTNRGGPNWQSFSIGGSNTLAINQPNAGALTLNSASLTSAALPQGGAVVVGAANISSAGPGSLDITTATDHTAINWQSFSIGARNTVTINQPNASSLTLNQVVGPNPSQIFGVLRSNGQVVLANPNGIWFGSGSHVDVASIVASTATASTAALNAFASGGALMLDQAGRADASIVNDGSISIGDEGLAALVAPGVANNGIIAARLGQIVLASGSTATLDFYGDGLISFAVGGAVTAAPKDLTGAALSAAVVNAGTITNDGGTVLLTAATAKTVIDNAINMSGVIVASAVDTSGGEIDLDGGTGAVNVSGTLDASSPGGQGGTINISGGKTVLGPNASMNAGSMTFSGFQSLQAAGDLAILATPVAGGIVADGGSIGSTGTTPVVAAVTLTSGGFISDLSYTGAFSGGLFGYNNVVAAGGLAVIDTASLRGSLATVGGLVGANVTSGSIVSAYTTGTIGGMAAVGGLVGSNDGTSTATPVGVASGIVVASPVATVVKPTQAAPQAAAAHARPLAQPPHAAALVLPDSVLHPVVTIPTIALPLPQSTAGSDSIAAIETGVGGISASSPGN